jgi:Tol biopolymer transport system component/DNA-binding winged helix-turn-helix (wHTH) protein
MNSSSATGRCVGYRFGVFEVDLQAQEIRKHGIRLKLTGQPLQVLRLLLERPGEVVAREDFQKELWPEQSWGDHDHKLNKSINKVRTTLGDSAETPRYIETLPRVGYRLLVPVERLTASVPEATSQPSSAPAVAVAPSAVSLPEEPTIRTDANRRLWLLAAAGMMAVVVAGVIMATASRDGERAALAEPLTTWAGIETSPCFSPDGKHIVFSSDSGSARTTDLHILNVATGETRRLTRNPGVEIAPSWSPDGNWVAFLRKGASSVWELRMVSPAGDNERHVAEVNFGNGNGSVSWGADSSSLYVSDRVQGDAVAVIRVAADSGARRQVTWPEPGKWDLHGTVSPDGKWLAFTRETSPSWREVFIMPAQGPDGPRQLTRLNLQAGPIAWAGGSDKLVFAAAAPSGGNHYLYSLNIATGEISENVAGARRDGLMPAVSRDGALLVFAQRKGSPSNIRSLPVSGGASERLLASNTRDYSPDFSPDGRSVVFSSTRSGAPQLWVYAPSTGALHQLTNLGNAGASVPRWSPDGRYVAFESRPDGNSDIHLVDVNTRAVRRLTHHERRDTYPSWSRDGKFLYFCSDRSGQRNILADACRRRHAGSDHAWRRCLRRGVCGRCLALLYDPGCRTTAQNPRQRRRGGHAC